MGIIVKNILVEAYHSISKIKYYHRPLQQVCLIVIIKILGIKPNLAFQMFFKDIKNLMGFNGLIFILLVFGAYFQMTSLDAPFS